MSLLKPFFARFGLLLLTLVVASCDTFRGDEVVDDKLVTINPEKVDYYVPDADIKSSSSVIINLREIVVQRTPGLALNYTRFPITAL